MPETIAPRALSTLQASLTGGSALPASTRARLESSFGTDLGDVRVHTGGAADHAADRLQAEAFTIGRDIGFAQGRYAPGTRSGDHLIAEEVAHVIQQRGGGQAVQRHAAVSVPGDGAEIQARMAADRAVSGKPANLPCIGLSLRGRIMRRARVGGVTPSPVVAAPSNGLGAMPGAPVLTPTMTSTLSPAGGKLVDSAARRPAHSGRGFASSPKAPDEAQTARPAESAGAPGVVTAGSSAGIGPGAAATQFDDGARSRKRRTEPDKIPEEQSDRRVERQARNEQGSGVARPATGGGGAFGRIEGDRGAAAAAAARRRLDERADALATNEGAQVRIGAARAAASPPPNAAAAAGQQSQAGALEAAEVPAGDPEAARSTMRGAVASATPGSIEDLEAFARPGGNASRDNLADAVADQAAIQTAPVEQSLSAVDAPPLGAAPPPAIPLPEPAPAPATPDPALTRAVPPPVNDDALDASEFREEADATLAEHDVDDATLARADEGPLRDIGNDKSKLDGQVDRAATRARATETQARDAARATLQGAGAGAQAEMENRRGAGQASVLAEQDGMRTGEEAAEQSLADRINATYRTAQNEVNARLSTLTQDAVSTFRDRQQARLDAFASGVRSDLDDLKRRRYSGARGVARRLRDWVLSINSVPEVQRLYQRHRDRYIADIDALITRIKADIDQTIADCKAALKTARETIEQMVSDNRDNLDADARAALQDATRGFREMETRIDQAAASARAALDRERERAIREMDAELDRIRSENAGLVDRIAAAISALAAALGQFMALMVRITRMGIGRFLSAALEQARDGIRNNLWGQLQEAFKQWLFMKLPVLQVLLALPPNWYEMLTALATNMIGLFTEHLPALLPAIGAAAMIWLATTLVAKLIPGVGAIMAVIDAIRGAYALVQSLFRAASAFLAFVMAVASRAGGGAVAFARALAYGIVAAVDAVLTFLGVDRLIRRVVGAIARPFGRIVRRIATRFRALMNRRRTRRRDRGGGTDGVGVGRNRRRNERRRAEDRRRDRRRQRADRERRRDRDTRRDRRETPAERRRRRQRDRERRRTERLRRAVAALRPRIGALLRRGVTRLRLRAQLAIWRVRYRIRKLTVEGRGSSARVVAGNSPDVTVRQVISGSIEGVYRMVHDIGQRRFGRARARSAQRGGVPSVQPGDEPSTLGAGLRDRGPSQVPTQPNRPDRLQFRGEVPMQVGGTRITGQQGGGRVANPDAVGNVIIPQLGTYPQITAQLAAQGLSGAGVTRAVTQALRTGQGPPVVQNLIALMFGAEPGRRPIASATSPLALMAMQQTPTARIFGDGSPVRGDLFGAADLDPVRRVRGANRPIGGGKAPFTAEGTGPAGRRNELRIIDGRQFREDTAIGRRSRADLLRTVELVYQAVRLMDFQDTAGLRREIELLFDHFDRAAGVNP